MSNNYERDYFNERYAGLSKDQQREFAHDLRRGLAMIEVLQPFWGQKKELREKLRKPALTNKTGLIYVAVVTLAFALNTTVGGVVAGLVFLFTYSAFKQHDEMQKQLDRIEDKLFADQLQWTQSGLCLSGLRYFEHTQPEDEQAHRRAVHNLRESILFSLSPLGVWPR